MSLTSFNRLYSLPSPLIDYIFELSDYKYYKRQFTEVIRIMNNFHDWKFWECYFLCCIHPCLNTVYSRILKKIQNEHIYEKYTIDRFALNTFFYFGDDTNNITIIPHIVFYNSYFRFHDTDIIEFPQQIICDIYIKGVQILHYTHSVNDDDRNNTQPKILW